MSRLSTSSADNAGGAFTATPGVAVDVAGESGASVTGARAAVARAAGEVAAVAAGQQAVMVPPKTTMTLQVLMQY